MDNLFLEPNLIILIFVISHWLLIWMKAFGGEPKQQVPRARWSSTSAGSLLTRQGRRASGLRLCLSTAGCHASPHQQPFPTPGSLCVQSASSSNSVGFKRIFCLHICTPSPFYKDGFKPRCLQERGWNECFHRGIQKIQFGENAIIFDEMGKGQEVSSVNYCRYNFLIKSGKKGSLFFLLLLY